jgi:hypothetical protein
MFIGHLALGFAAKRLTPRVSLAMLLLAAQWADTVWPLFLMLGLEQVRIEPGNTAFTPFDFVSYPYSHSLLALMVWGLLVGGAYRGIAGGRRSVWVLSALVISHWVLDVLTHRPDMPLYPGGPKYGLGMWNVVPLTLTVEFAMFGVGLFLYERATRARDAVGRWGLLALVTALVLVYVGSALSGPPPSVQAVAIAAFVLVPVMTAWAWWVDRHRDIIL